MNLVDTGLYTGKGKNQTFTLANVFSAGDSVVLRAYVVDASTGLPVANATVDLAISGPESVNLTAGPSDTAGMAEASWMTTKPNKRGQGGTTPGSYTATVTNVTASCYTWDGVLSSASFTIQ